MKELSSNKLMIRHFELNKDYLHKRNQRPYMLESLTKTAIRLQNLRRILQAKKLINE